MASNAVLFAKEPQNIIGAIAPFFDRLIDLDPSTDTDNTCVSFLGRDAVKESIMREVACILNTRRGARQAFYDEVEDDAIYFGLPSLFGFTDFQSFDALSNYDKRKIINLCEKSITLFEPRLSDISVTINGYDSHHQVLYISVSGIVQLQSELERLQFPVSIDYHT